MIRRRQDTFDAIVAAHRAIRRFTERAADTDDPEVLGPLVAELDRVLQNHFAAEERPGGYLDRIRLGHATGERLVRELIAEHRAFEREVPALRAALECAAPGVIEQAGALAERLGAHERREAWLTGDL